MTRPNMTLYNFRMDDPTNTLLDLMATGSNRSQVVHDLILGWGELQQIAMAQQKEALATLVDRVGRDGYLVIFADADEDGNPVVTIAGLKRGETKGFYEGLKGVGHVVGDKCWFFLDFGDLAPDPYVMSVGDAMVRIPSAQMSLGPVNWPPNEHTILRLPLHMLMPAVEEDAAPAEAEAEAEAETVES